jgi:hypothetical protein
MVDKTEMSGGEADTIETTDAGAAGASGATGAGGDAGAGKDTSNVDAGAAGGKTAADGGDKAAAETISWPEKGFPDDWKTRLLAGFDGEVKTKAEKYLGTRASLPDILRAALSADSRISDATKGRVKVPTGKDDPKEVVEAWNKVIGRPETADKFAVYTPEGVELDPGEKEVVDEFLKDMHLAGAGQKQVDAGLKAYYRVKATAERAVEARAAQAAEAAQEALRVEYGRDYKANVELANRFLQEELGKYMKADEVTELMGKRFADGTAFGEYPGLVKMFVAQAKEWAGDGAMIVADVGSGGLGDIETKIKAIEALRLTDMKEYQRREPELDTLLAAQARMAKKV